eukprot:685308-Pyramimonas_sp.AAC.1
MELFPPGPASDDLVRRKAQADHGRESILLFVFATHLGKSSRTAMFARNNSAASLGENNIRRLLTRGHVAVLPGVSASEADATHPRWKIST